MFTGTRWAKESSFAPPVTMLSAKCTTGTIKATNRAKRPANRRPATTPTRKTTNNGAKSTRLIAKASAVSLSVSNIHAALSWSLGYPRTAALCVRGGC